MAKDFSKGFYNRKSWQACRASYIAKRITIDGGLCEHCHELPGHIVHHKVLLTASNVSNPQISLNHDNLAFVCKDCHDAEHYKEIYGKSPPKTMCDFDADGEPTPPIRR